jgi:hypothetical protein
MRSFTPRRKGAKKAFQSKSIIPFLDLGGFASLRETSVTQSGQEFFTPRRKGAKRRSKSKHQRFFGHTIGEALNAVLDRALADEAKNLSGLAPLLETCDCTDNRHQASR